MDQAGTSDPLTIAAQQIFDGIEMRGPGSVRISQGRIEGIAFDRQALLWAVAEAGARHGWDHFFARRLTPFFPLVFALDTERLE